MTILNNINELIDEILEPISYRAIKQNLFGNGWNNRQLSNNFASLERVGYIKIDRKSDSIVLTAKGKIKLIENSSSRETDNRWRMVSYDIPEQIKIKRIRLCASLRRIGFKQVQKSLWCCPYVIADKLDLIIKELELEKYVAFLLVERTDIELHLKNLFNGELR